MKTKTAKIITTGISLLILFFFSTTGFTAGLLTPSGRSLPALLLKEHHVCVTVEDGYVITRIDQSFFNPNSMDLEALYTFPVPETASVAEFSLWIDGKKVPGEVVEKEKAKEIYEEEKAAGHETGLTEKNELNSFEIKVFPVKANDTTRMRLVYIQPVTVDTGMGRYVYPLESGGVDDVQESFWTANEKVEEKFSFVLHLRSSIPVDGLRVPGFPKAAVTKTSPREWTVDINKGSIIQQSINPEDPVQVKEQGDLENTAVSSNSQAAFTLDKDILVYWRQAANIPARVDMVTYKPAKDKQGTFMITITPGDDLKEIQKGRDWVFVLDRSGSMDGKFETLLNGVERALGKMNDKDRFRIIMFENQAEEITSGFVTATQQNVKNMINTLGTQRPGGGTNLYEGLKKGLKVVDADRTTSMVLVTDGVANVGVTKQKSFIELLKKKDIRLFTLMMGNSNNEFLLKHLAHASNGFAQSVSNSDDIVGLILSVTSKVTHEALHGTKLSVRGIPVKKLVTNNTSSLYRGQQLIYFGHYKKAGQADLVLTGKISGENKQYETTVSFPEVAMDHPEIERLWAYAAIDQIKRAMVFETDESESEQAIISLSTKYGIVTDYTSMLVVRDEIFKKHGIRRSNKKRLAVEEKAQQKRASAPVVSRRVDTRKPMYKSHQSSHRSFGGGGGGAVDPWFFVILLPLAAVKFKKKRTS